MNDQNQFLEKVVQKTNVKKEDIFSLANDLQKKNLNNENDIREFIGTVAKMTNKTLNESKVDKLVSMIKNNKVPKDIDKMV